MIRYTLDGLAAALPPETPVEKAHARAANVVQLPLGGVSRAFAGRRLPDMAAAAHAGLSRTVFDALTPEQMNNLLAAILAIPQITAVANAGRAEWLRYLFALADAEQQGATNARRLALRWSALGAMFDQAGFDRDWASFRPGGVGVGSLIAAAREAGFDFSPWFHQPQAPAAEAAPAAWLTPAGFMQPLPSGAANLRPVPWIVLGLLLRGDLTVIAGQGGGAKTALAISLSAALAAGLANWGPFSLPGKPLRVLYISGEEDGNRLGLLVEATCPSLGLTAAERQVVAAHLLVHDARTSGWRLGEPRLGTREDMAPEGEDRMCDALRDALKMQPVDVVVFDTLAGLFALSNENDNAAVTRLLNRLARVVREAGCAALLIHHAPKATREATAAQRGEPTLVRGGGAIVNSSRVVWSLTGLPPVEAASAAVMGLKPDAVRRLDPVKMNDCAPPTAAFLEVMSVPVPMADGSHQSTRAVRFIQAPASTTAGGLPPATLNVVMRTIDAGVVVGGVKLPLSPGGGQTNARVAVQHVAHALRVADPGLSDVHAQAAARQALKHLRDVLGCIEVCDVPAPKQAGGKANGKRTVKGLVTRWELAPWPGATTYGTATVAPSTPELPTA